MGIYCELFSSMIFIASEIERRTGHGLTRGHRDVTTVTRGLSVKTYSPQWIIDINPIISIKYWK